MQDEMSFGTWLKERRRALDITQWDLAERVGCAEDTIQKIESNARRPSRQMAELLVEILQVPLEDRAEMVVFARTGASPPPSALDSSRRWSTESAPTLTPPPTNLPAPLTALIGREDALDALIGQLKRPERRLITLVGPPGIGKTRLALGVGAACLDSFKDGIYFVPLAPVREASLVSNAIAKALGLPDSGSSSLLDNLREYLRGKEMLLLLDNFEQVVVAAPSVVELLTACPRMKVLVTSRELLLVRGEFPYAVPPMALPDLEHLPSPGELRQSPAVALFSERAESTRPDFALDASNSHSVAAICVRLEGLPLAIELAAARTRLLSPNDILSQLDRSLSLLVGGPRDLPTRQQTLKAAIEWSYDLLRRVEQQLFARMSVFAGGATLNALDAVCNAHDDLEGGVGGALEGLLQQSLVYSVNTQGHGRDEPAGKRFNMLEMLREYASEKLAERSVTGAAEISEDTAVSRYHAEYYLAVAEAAEPELRLARYDKWCTLLEFELDNIRAALHWALGAPAQDLVLGVRMASAMGLFWYGKGHHIEGIRWTQRLLERLDEVPVTYHAPFLISAGNLAFMSDLGVAQRLFERALDISRQLEDKLHAAWALCFLGYAMLREPDVAMPIAEEGLALFRELNHLPGVAQNLNIIGEISRSRGDDERAKRVYEECLSICRQTGETRRIGLVSATLCLIAQHEGDYERALDLGRQALQMACDRKNKTDIAFCLVGVAGSIYSGHPQGAGATAAITGTTGKALANPHYPQIAARLLGAQEAALERIGAMHQPADEPEVARIVAEVREHLDEATFRACWGQGREMTIEQAVAAALDEWP